MSLQRKRKKCIICHCCAMTAFIWPVAGLQTAVKCLKLVTECSFWMQILAIWPQIPDSQWSVFYSENIKTRFVTHHSYLQMHCKTQHFVLFLWQIVSMPGLSATFKTLQEQKDREQILRNQMEMKTFIDDKARTRPQTCSLGKVSVRIGGGSGAYQKCRCPC